MRIFRLESRNTRKGPFRNGCARYVQTHTHNHQALKGSFFRNIPHRDLSQRHDCDPYEHHGPLEDYLIAQLWNDASKEARNALFFGFETVEQYTEWFTCELSRKQVTQYRGGCMVLREYEVDDHYVLKETYQVAFLRDEARKVRDHCPTITELTAST